jgi:enolase
MSTIEDILAREILDSRGNPTVEVEVILEDGSWGRAAVPSGASTGVHEALELRDGDKSRYNGNGVLKAVENVEGVIAPELVGWDATDQKGIDEMMIALDGTPNKATLGANAMLVYPWQWPRPRPASLRSRSIAILAASTPRSAVPMMNILNGGKPRWMVPICRSSWSCRWAPMFCRGAALGCRDLSCPQERPQEQGVWCWCGDEGGFAPSLKTNEEAIEVILAAIEKAGYKAGEQMFIAMDPAASEVYEDGKYNLKKDGRVLSSEEMVDFYADWVARYPIISIEDGLAEDDWDGFKLMTKRREPAPNRGR